MFSSHVMLILQHIGSTFAGIAMHCYNIVVFFLKPNYATPTNQRFAKY